MQPQNQRSQNDRSYPHNGHDREPGFARNQEFEGWEREMHGGSRTDENYGMSRDRPESNRYIRGSDWPERGHERLRPWQGRPRGDAAMRGEAEGEFRDRGSYHETGYGRFNEGYGERRHGMNLDDGRVQLRTRFEDRNEYQHGDSPYGPGWGGHGFQSTEPDRWSREYGRETPGARREFIGKGPKGYTRSDERIREEVCERLAGGYLDASDIEVAVENGEVTLTGTVADRRTKRMAEEILDNISGIKDFNNNLKLKTAATGQKEKEPTSHKTKSRGEA
jgi:hypothetical protein